MSSGCLGIEERGGVSRDFCDRRDVRRRDGRRRCHRLERRLAEALVEAREDEARRPPVERRQLLAGDEPADLDARWDGAAVVAAAREDEPELRPLLPQQRERVEEAGVVLVRPRPRRVEQERLALLVAGAEALVVDAPRDRVDALGRDPQQLDRTAADELARHDHGVRVAGGALVRSRPEEPLGPREELGMIQMLEVVDGHGRGELERRQRNRERVVDGVQAGEARPQPAGPDRRERHRERSLGDAARVPVLRHRRLRQPLAGAECSGRRERDVVQCSHLRQAAREPARRRLRAADLAGDEREEAEPDPHRQGAYPPCPVQSSDARRHC